MPVKIYFLLPYAERTAPSQRFRVEAYFETLKKHDIPFRVGHFWNASGNAALYRKGNFLGKLFYFLRGFLVRWWQVLVKMRGAEYVFVHREAAPLGPPLFEWVIAKIFRRKIIYDFDDAIWIPNVSANNRLATSLKAFWKVKQICKWSYRISAGNAYLGKWAAQYNANIVFNPTCVDMEARYNTAKEQNTKTVTIGWTGSHSTLKYLDLVKPVLEELESEFDFTFLVICDQPPQWTLRSLRFVKWNETSEIRDLHQINIGIMPLRPDEWSEGKCGFKLIQYLALGIPAVASPVGVNMQILRDGENGFLCNDGESWKRALTTLLQDSRLRSTMGVAGRTRMRAHYSLQSNEANFISLFT